MNLFHRHGPWEVVSTSCDGYLHWYARARRHAAITHVVSRCRGCGALRERDLPGRHTVEALRGEADEVARILKSLEKEK